MDPQCNYYVLLLSQGSSEYHFLCLQVQNIQIYIILGYIVFFQFTNILIFFVECEKLIRHMLVVEPERRLSISQILAHSWMGGDGVTEPEPGG